MGFAHLLFDHAHRLNVEQYHRMIEAGVFDEDDHLELLEGIIVAMSPQSPPHARVIERLADAVFTGLPREYVVRPQLPLTVGDDSEPEPDIAIVLRTPARSLERHPGTALLVIEVSRASLRRDRVVKGAIYARAGIPEFVIVDVDKQRLEVFRQPNLKAGVYRVPGRLNRRQRFVSKSVPGFTFSSLDLLQ